MKVGKVINYNNQSGYIVDNLGNKYLLLSQNIISDNIKNGDFVQFNIETYKTVEIEEHLATLVTKINIPNDN